MTIKKKNNFFILNCLLQFHFFKFNILLTKFHSFYYRLILFIEHQMVRVKYTLLVKLFAIVFFAFFILPAFLRLIGGPASPKDHRGQQKPRHGNNDYGVEENGNNQNDKAPSRIGTVIILNKGFIFNLNNDSTFDQNK